MNVKMQVKRFQNKVAESRIALPITGIYAFLVCVAGGLFQQHLWAQFVLLALSSFLMMELNNANALIRIYSRMVSCSFLVLASMSHFLFADIQCGIVQACFVAFYLFLFSAYQETSSVGRVFYAFLMLGIISMMFVQILYFIPVVWVLMCTNIMVGGVRVFASSVLGIVLPYWFLGGYFLYLGKLSTLAQHFVELTQFGSMEKWLNMPLNQILTIFMVASLAILGIIHFRINNYKDKIRTRMLFEFFSVMILFTLVFMILQPEHIPFLFTLLIVSTSPMIGHYIALTNTFVSNISFYVILVAITTLTICNLWVFS